ncbi:MAG: primosomal replication protein N [Burkholderiales bacterium]|nr:primosomal replication protein N [Burkholderiales bacterium]
MNRVDLIAHVEEISPLRYTPSGLPVVEFRLIHESETEEAGIVRKVRLNLKSIAVGILAEKLIRQPLHTSLLFSGFLASGKNSKSVIFHIHSYQTVS